MRPGAQDICMKPADHRRIDGDDDHSRVSTKRQATSRKSPHAHRCCVARRTRQGVALSRSLVSLANQRGTYVQSVLLKESAR